MMFKTTTLIALTAALMSGTQAAALDTASKVEARDTHPLCPRNTDVCGFYLLNPQPQDGRPFSCLTPDQIKNLNLGTGTDYWGYIYSVNATGYPYKIVKECKKSCTMPQIDLPKPICNEDRHN